MLFFIFVMKTNMERALSLQITSSPLRLCAFARFIFKKYPKVDDIG